MSARLKLLAATLGIVVATTACSGIIQDSSRGSTLPPLGASGPPTTNPPPATLPSLTTSVATTTAPTTTTSTTTSVPDTTTSTSTASTSTAESTNATGVDGVQGTIAGRSLSFGQACLDGRNVTLNGVTWAFAGNSFRLAGDGDIRSEAELVGDGWTMPMLVGSVSSGVYTYRGVPTDDSVSAAQVVIDFNELDSC